MKASDKVCRTSSKASRILGQNRQERDIGYCDPWVYQKDGQGAAKRNRQSC